ncbi:MAG: hypothetical protein HY253_00715 [Burkholderiales bacterium]|nr:hypothetical protein [Burkholderiales bacterium]
MGLLNFFRSSPELSAAGSKQTEVEETAALPEHSLRPGEPGFVERRKMPDRRIQERRKINCKPYLDTRENHGRRRSFGRRSTDPGNLLPF